MMSSVDDRELDGPVATDEVLETSRGTENPLLSGEKSRAASKSDRRVVKCKYTAQPKPANNEGGGIIGILMHPMNVLLIFLPFGVAAYFLEWGSLYLFWLNFAAMIPLAKILGDATEELAAGLRNDMIAGLLNATFGNAVEMMITVQTLRAGLYNVVKMTLLGSVLSNVLLVLGMSFFCGGVFSKKHESNYAPMNRVENDSDGGGGSGGAGDATLVDFNEKIQSFSVLGALVNTSMLLISCMSFCLITIYRTVGDFEDPAANEEFMTDVLLPVSRIASILAMLAYMAYIFFQLVTHKDAMSDGGDGEDDSENHLSLYKSISLLFVVTCIVAMISDLVVHAIHGVAESNSMSQHFIGIILLPIVGNACEHAAAVRFAVEDKLGLSVSIAIGSSTQIALFVVPFSVIMGWAMDKPMDLNFGILNTTVMTLSVVVVLSMVVDGQSNWLQGYLLCTVYGIIAVMYWYLPDDVNQIN